MSELQPTTPSVAAAPTAPNGIMGKFRLDGFVALFSNSIYTPKSDCD